MAAACGVLMILIVALAACAPTYYGITRKCPTTMMLLGDSLVTAAALGVAALRYSNGDRFTGVAIGTGAVGFGVAVNVAEIRGCKR